MCILHLAQYSSCGDTSLYKITWCEVIVGCMSNWHPFYCPSQGTSVAKTIETNCSVCDRDPMGQRRQRHNDGLTEQIRSDFDIEHTCSGTEVEIAQFESWLGASGSHTSNEADAATTTAHTSPGVPSASSSAGHRQSTSKGTVYEWLASVLISCIESGVKVTILHLADAFNENFGSKVSRRALPTYLYGSDELRTKWRRANGFGESSGAS